MAEYFPLVCIFLFLGTLLLWIFWPWLRRADTRFHARTGVVLALFLSLALYLAAGNPFAVPAIKQQQELFAKQDVQARNLREKAEKTPEEWVELAELEGQLQNYSAAEEAYKQAVKTSSGNPDYILSYGKAQMVTAEGAITEGAKRAFELASKLMPRNPEPKFFLGIERVQAGDKAGARKLFTALAKELPEDSPYVFPVNMQLRKLQ